MLEGQSFAFSCTPTPNDIVVNWTMNGDIIVSSDHIALSPEHLDHTITISNVVTGDSGEYVCFIEDLEFLSIFINKTITINVLQGNFDYTYIRMYVYVYFYVLCYIHIRMYTYMYLTACPQNYVGGILWNKHRVNETARVRCSNFYSSFRPAVYITRMCTNSGEWGNVDYSSCTMRPEALPLIMVEVKDLNSSVSTTSVVNQVGRCV